ncbi:hypothetical protein [Pseudomonas phage D6]|nr:hypothetical protein [Pseudomonas phage D6]
MQVSKKTVHVPATELGDLNEFLNRTFSTKKNNRETLVKLEKVTNRDVQLSYAKSERVDRFTISQEKFRKYYCLLSSVKVEEPVETA